MSDNEYKYESAFSDRERVYKQSKLLEMVPSDLLDGTPESYKRRTRTQRFLINVDAISRNLINDDESNSGLSEDDITKMLEHTENNDIDYKNPCGWVLGYIVNKGFINKTEKDSLSFVIKSVLKNANTSNTQDSWGVTSPDVVRYMRYWNRLV